MCGRYGFGVESSQVMEHFQLQAETEEWAANKWERYDVRPTQMVPVLIQDENGKRKIIDMRWGFQPHWSTSPLINARTEKLIESKVWKKPFTERRCIVIASYFYEWQDVGKAKTLPWLIKLKDKKIMSFAGMYTEETDKKTGAKVLSCTIMTSDANPLMRKIHNHGVNKHRQPVFIEEKDYDKWLNNKNSEAEALLSLIKFTPENEMEAFELVSIGNDKTHTKPIKMNLKEK